MSDEEKNVIEKHLAINELLCDSKVMGIPELKYLNLDSDELLDEKIEVLKALKKGKTIEEIPNFYDILEDLPKEGIWD